MTRTYTIHISRKNAKRHAIPSRHYIMTRIEKKGCIIFGFQQSAVSNWLPEIILFPIILLE